MERGHVHIRAVGDIAPGDFTITGLGVLGVSKRFGCDYLFLNIRNELKDCDLLLGNLEGTLSHRCKTENLRLCGLPGMANSLRQIGFDVLSVANNHVLDHGPEIFKETVSHCKQAGLLLAGLRGNSEFYSQPVIIDKNGLKLGILAYNWVGLEETSNSGEYIASIYDSIVNYTWNRDRGKKITEKKSILSKNKEVIEDIKKLRILVDIIILMPHWGFEWTIYPPFGITREARSFIDAGADLILGTHSHVPQGIEVYKNKLLVYSMGNFLFDSGTNKFRYGMMVEYKVHDAGYNYQLLFIDRDNQFRPKLASKDSSIRNMEIINKSSIAISSPDAHLLLDDDRVYLEFEKQYNALKVNRILYLLRNIPKHPLILVPIFRKIWSLLKLIILRMQGKKIRW